MSEPEPGAASPGSPTCYRDALRCFARHVVPERGPVSTALALHAASEEGRQNLEQVGVILRRLDLEMEDILALRAKTRAILAELAA